MKTLLIAITTITSLWAQAQGEILNCPIPKSNDFYEVKLGIYSDNGQIFSTVKYSGDNQLKFYSTHEELTNRGTKVITLENHNLQFQVDREMKIKISQNGKAILEKSYITGGLPGFSPPSSGIARFNCYR